MVGRLLIVFILACICAIPVAIVGGLTGDPDATPTPASRLAELPVETPIAEPAANTPAPTFTQVTPPTPTPLPPTEALIPTDTLNPTAIEDTVFATVLAEVINVRLGPGTAYEVIGQIRQGEQAATVGCNETCDWIRLARL